MGALSTHIPKEKSMLHQNFMFGIQNQIKKNKKNAVELTESDVSTEVDAASEKAIEEAYNPGFQFTIYEMTEKAKKKIDDKKVLTTESFSLGKAKKKLERDIQYFNYLYESFVPESLKEDYEAILESTLETTIRLYQECDVTPRVMSPALNSEELTESQLVDLYKNGLNKTIKDEYTKPLLSGQIAELYESELQTLVKALIEEGADVDMEAVSIYLPFEESLTKFNKEVLLPEAAMRKVEAFIESQGELVDIFEDTAADILAELQKKIKLLTSLVAPGAFDAAVDSDVDGSKMAGITIVTSGDFDQDSEPCIDDICQAEIESDDEASKELEDELEANDIHDEDKDGDDSDDLEGGDIEGIETIEIKDELSDAEEDAIDDEIKDVQAVEDSDGTDEGSAEETEIDDDEVEGAPEEPELPGEKAEGEETEGDEAEEIDSTDEEVNSDDEEEEDKEEELVEEKEKKETK